MNNKVLNIALWLAQSVIALLLLMAGFMKLVTPIEELSKTLAWTADIPQILVKGLSLLDIAGGIGIVLPAILRIKPKLTPTAAIGIILLMASAIVMHLSRGETSVIGINVVIIFLAVFVYWGRTKKIVIAPKKS